MIAKIKVKDKNDKDKNNKNKDNKKKNIFAQLVKVFKNPNLFYKVVIGIQ